MLVAAIAAMFAATTSFSAKFNMKLRERDAWNLFAGRQ
jgi:hypothetical protein